MTAVDETPAPEATPDGWQRLDRRTIAVSAALALGAGVVAGVPTTVGVASGTGIGVTLAWVVPCVVVFVAAAAAVEAVRWRALRYRVTDDRLELSFDFVVHTRRTIRTNRIRTVDVTANPLHRVFGLAELTAGSGAATSSSDRVRLAPLSRADADHLRQELLRRRRRAASSEPGTDDRTLATMDRRWLRYVPVSFLTPALGVAAFGAVLQLANWFGLQESVVDRALDLLARTPVAVTIPVVLAAVVVIGTIGSLGLFVEMWSHYRLERGPDATLRVRRGLLTTRSVSIEESRLRGVEKVEPLGNRLSGAARVDAIAIGLHSDDDKHTDHRTLVPAAPRAFADHIVAAALGEPTSPSEIALRSHPRAARSRRLLRAVAAALVVPVVLLVLGVLLTDVLVHLAWITAVVSLPVAVALASDAYRGLGHALTDDYLVVRSGSVRRSTVVLRRSGIIGWAVQQTPFQRRSGLMTVTALTGAGNGGYRVRDIGEDDGIDLVRAADLALVDQFIDHETDQAPRLTGR